MNEETKGEREGKYCRKHLIKLPPCLAPSAFPDFNQIRKIGEGEEGESAAHDEAQGAPEIKASDT